MTDLVNEHFRKHYPPDWNANWETDRYGFRRYQGVANRIFPSMICADGFAMSVQGHAGAYSKPRGDFAGHYDEVEVLCPRDPILDAVGQSEKCGDDRLYGYVPVEVVESVIAAHGGLAIVPARDAGSVANGWPHRPRARGRRR